jgi:hypothetical protein
MDKEPMTAFGAPTRRLGIPVITQMGTMVLFCLMVGAFPKPGTSFALMSVTPTTKASHHQRSKMWQPSSVVRSTRTAAATALRNNNNNQNNGWFQDLIPEFLQKREGDFVRLEKESTKAYGPGPMIVLYNVPSTIADDEFRDMIADCTTPDSAKRCVLHRIDHYCTGPTDSREESASSSTTSSLHSSTTAADKRVSLLALSVEEALQKILKDPSLPPTMAEKNAEESTTALSKNGVLFFSGFSNHDMLAVYKIMADEIYQESGGRNNVACAKAVPNAMQKPLGQVLDEICGDHQQAVLPT